MSTILLLALGMMMMTTAITSLAINSGNSTTSATDQKGGFNAPCEIDADCESTLICKNDKKCFFRPPPRPVLPGKKLEIDENCKTDDDCQSNLICSPEGKCTPIILGSPPSDCTVAGCPGDSSECDSTTKSCRAKINI